MKDSLGFDGKATKITTKDTARFLLRLKFGSLRKFVGESKVPFYRRAKLELLVGMNGKLSKLLSLSGWNIGELLAKLSHEK